MPFLTMHIRKEHVMRIDLKIEFNEISFDDDIITVICHFLKLGYCYITFTS